MKKSNKLLLGGFLALLLLISAIHITLYAKYKAGDYTIYNAEDDLPPSSMQSFPNIVFVSVRNVPVATVRFADVAQVEKSEDDAIQYVRKGDTLLITARDSADQGGIRQPVEFHLPSNATISVSNSSLLFEKGKSSAENNSVIHPQKSAARFSGRESVLQLGRVKVVASDGSTASFQGKVQINSLEVQLSNSSFDYGEGDFNQLSIATDSASRISLQSKHLLKANINTITPK